MNCLEIFLPLKYSSTLIYDDPIHKIHLVFYASNDDVNLIYDGVMISMTK